MCLAGPGPQILTPAYAGWHLVTAPAPHLSSCRMAAAPQTPSCPQVSITMYCKHVCLTYKVKWGGVILGTVYIQVFYMITSVHWWICVYLSFSHVGSGKSGISGYGSTSTNDWKLPQKLQIVKPIEGSLTLHQWSRLATPHLGGLLEEREGVAIKVRTEDTHFATRSVTVT